MTLRTIADETPGKIGGETFCNNIELL